MMSYNQSEVLVNTYVEDKFNITLEVSQRSKPLIDNLVTLSETIEEYRIKPYLVTLIHNPMYMLKSEAWRNVKEARERIINYMLEEDNTIVYGISSIEVHPGKNGSVNASIRDELEKEVKKTLDIANNIDLSKDIKKYVGEIKAKGRKVKTKVSLDMILKGKELLKRVSKNASKVEIHHTIISGFKRSISSAMRSKWENKDYIEKLRRVISFYESIGVPEDIYKYLIDLWKEETISAAYREFLNTYAFIPDELLTLSGYPHIHIAIGVVSSGGRYSSPIELKKKLQDLALYEDVRVDERKNNKSANKLHSIGYVLKNDKYKLLKEILNEAIVKGFVRMEELVTPIYEMCYKKLASGKLRPLFEIELKTLSGGAQAMSSSDGYDKVLSYIISRMEEGGYAASGNNVYGKIKGSRISYEKYMSVEEFYDSALEGTKIAKDGGKYKSIICGWMRLNKKKIEGITEMRGIKMSIPRIKFDRENVWIECKDFFYSCLTGRLTQTNTKYPCYCYCDWLSLEELGPRMMVEYKEGPWIGILKNSKIEIRDIGMELYRSLVMPKIPKGKSPYLTGPANSGKTSIFKPFINIYPDHQVDTLYGDISRFDLYNKLEASIFQLDDFNPYTKSSESMLKFLATEPMHVEQKHGGSKRALVRGRSFMTNNEHRYLDDDEDEVTKAIEKRIITYEFTSLPDVKEEASVVIKDMSALVVIMCGFFYFGRDTGKDVNKIMSVLILSTEEETDKDVQQRLEYYEDYYKGRSKKSGHQLEHDDWVKAHRMEYVRASIEGRKALPTQS